MRPPTNGLSRVTNPRSPHSIAQVPPRRSRKQRTWGCPLPWACTRWAGKPARFGAALTVLVLNACQPRLSIGEWTCSEDGTPSTIPETTAAVSIPWSSGFENRFCDYTELAGFCYADPAASSTELVTSPVHSGRYAAAFTVKTDAGGDAQTRCVRQGTLPTAAYYGAWYYIPEPTKPTGNWNLFHFRSGDELTATHGLMDVSLVAEGSDLHLGVFGVRHVRIGEALNPPPVPIGSWFHVQLFFKRAADMTGEVALYQDGEQLFDVTDLVTDDASLGQWYVGNLATDLSPSTATLYVDDVTLSSSL